jgi:hypothetical protein
MVKSDDGNPAFSNASARYGASNSTYRADDVVSGRITPTLPLPFAVNEVRAVMAEKSLVKPLAEVEAGAAVVVGVALGAVVAGAAVVADGAAVVGVVDFELLPQAVTAIPVAAISATTARLLVVRKEIPLVCGLPIGSGRAGRGYGLLYVAFATYDVKRERLREHPKTTVNKS